MTPSLTTYWAVTAIFIGADGQMRHGIVTVCQATNAVEAIKVAKAHYGDGGAISAIEAIPSFVVFKEEHMP